MTPKWGKITTKDILEAVNGILVAGSIETVFPGYSTDSRDIRKKDLFWALIGEWFDGHDFIQKAIEKGASGIVAHKDRLPEINHANDASVIIVKDSLQAFGDLAAWWRRQHNTQVVSITGSDGKTTTKEMITEILKMGSPVLATEGNFNNLIGLPMTLLKLEEQHKIAVLEMGMNRAGEIRRLTEISDPDVGVITNVGFAHLEGLGDIKGVAAAKTELVEKISSKGQVLINGDDKLLTETATRYGKNTVTFGFGQNNDIRGTDFKNLGQNGCCFDIPYHDKKVSLRINVPGIQNASNALAAAAVSICLGTPSDHIVDGLKHFKGVKGRFSMISLAKDILLVDDTYNANPSSLKAALETIIGIKKGAGRIIAGLGDMMELGSAVEEAHFDAGRMVARADAHLFLAIGDHAPNMVSGALDGGMASTQVKQVTTHEEMVRIICAEMKKGDLIFIKGSRKAGLDKVVNRIKGENH